MPNPMIARFGVLTKKNAVSETHSRYVHRALKTRGHACHIRPQRFRPCPANILSDGLDAPPSIGSAGPARPCGTAWNRRDDEVVRQRLPCGLSQQNYRSGPAILHWENSRRADQLSGGGASPQVVDQVHPVCRRRKFQSLPADRPAPVSISAEDRSFAGGCVEKFRDAVRCGAHVR